NHTTEKLHVHICLKAPELTVYPNTSQVFKLYIRLIFRKHGTCNKIFLKLIFYNTKKRIYPLKTSRNELYVVIGKNDVGRFIFIMINLYHPPGTSAGASRIRIVHNPYLIVFKRFKFL